jgi:hypothetical protein
MIELPASFEPAKQHGNNLANNLANNSTSNLAVGRSTEFFRGAAS